MNKRRNLSTRRRRTERAPQALNEFIDDVALESVYGLYLSVCDRFDVRRTCITPCAKWAIQLAVSFLRQGGAGGVPRSLYDTLTQAIAKHRRKNRSRLQGNKFVWQQVSFVRH